MTWRGVIFIGAALAAIWLVANFAVAFGADFVDGYKEKNRPVGSDAERLRDATLLWRSAAWRDDDFLAAVELGVTYDRDAETCTDDADTCANNAKLFGGRTISANSRIEAYVWYYLATHSERFSKYLFHVAGQNVIQARLKTAMDGANKLFLKMSEGERAEARNRIIYVLSCQGTDGLIRLATIYNDTNTTTAAIPDLRSLNLGVINGSFQQTRKLAEVPAENSKLKAIGLVTTQVFSRDKLASLMFLYIAQAKGSVLAGQIAKQLENARPAPEQPTELSPEDVRETRNAAKRWVPPFEFYPRPFSDECVRSADEERKLRKIADYIDPDEIKQALWFLQYLHGNREQWPASLARAVGDFQDALSHERTGKLTPEEMLRLIQMAAVNGHTPSQVRLGVLYAKGQALRPDYQRAANWFSAAAKQRDGQAMYYLGEMVKKGYVYEDDTASSAAAVAFYVQAALAGHGPNKERFKDLLDAGPCQNCNRSTRETLPLRGPAPAAPKAKDTKP